MLKKIISGLMITGMIAAGFSAFACNCGEQYRTYEYNYRGNNKHEVAFFCSYKYCDDPFTIVGTVNCVYEDGDDVCIDCGHVRE